MGHHQSIRMCAEVGAKGLFGDSAGNVIAFSAIAKRSCQSAATRVHRRHREADLSQQRGRDGAFVFGMAVGVHHHWSLVGREIGPPRMLIPLMEQEGFEIVGVGGKSLGGRRRDVGFQFCPVFLHRAGTGWLQCDDSYSGVLLSEFVQSRSRLLDVLSGRPEPSDGNIGAPTAANVFQDHLVSERFQELDRRQAEVGVVEAREAVGHQKHTGLRG